MGLGCGREAWEKPTKIAGNSICVSLRDRLIMLATLGDVVSARACGMYRQNPFCCVASHPVSVLAEPGRRTMEAAGDPARTPLPIPVQPLA